MTEIIPILALVSVPVGLAVWTRRWVRWLVALPMAFALYLVFSAIVGGAYGAVAEADEFHHTHTEMPRWPIAIGELLNAPGLLLSGWLVPVLGRRLGEPLAILLPFAILVGIWGRVLDEIAARAGRAESSDEEE